MYESESDSVSERNATTTMHGAAPAILETVSGPKQARSERTLYRLLDAAEALIVEQGLRPVVVGVVLGLIGTAAATRVLQTLLFDVSATDPVTLIGVASGVTAIAVLAALVPARRATRIDPLVALRE